MLEFIGLAVVLWVVWTVVKGIGQGAVRSDVLKGVDYACARGVSRETAMFWVQNEMMSLQMSILASKDARYNKCSRSEQIGKALCSLSQREVELADKVRDFVNPQLLALKAEGTRFLPTYITLAYLRAVAHELSGMRDYSSKYECIYEFEKLADLLHVLFPNPDKELLTNCSNAMSVALSVRNFNEICDLLLPIVRAELANGTGCYLVKYTRKTVKGIEDMFVHDPDFDPRNEPDDDFLNV
jgi:hypothetical protein